MEEDIPCANFLYWRALRATTAATLWVPTVLKVLSVFVRTDAGNHCGWPLSTSFFSTCFRRFRLFGFFRNRLWGQMLRKSILCCPGGSERAFGGILVYLLRHDNVQRSLGDTKVARWLGDTVVAWPFGNTKVARPTGNTKTERSETQSGQFRDHFSETLREVAHFGKMLVKVILDLSVIFFISCVRTMFGWIYTKHQLYVVMTTSVSAARRGISAKWRGSCRALPQIP